MPLCRRAVDGFERVLGAEHPCTIASVNTLALCLYGLGDAAGALPLCRRAVDGFERVSILADETFQHFTEPGQARNAPPVNACPRPDIAAAVAAYDSANPDAPLRRKAARLLAVMFPSEDVCQRSLDAIAGEGRKRLPAALKRLVEAGFLSRQPGSGVVPDTYRLHLPPVRP